MIVSVTKFWFGVVIRGFGGRQAKTACRAHLGVSGTEENMQYIGNGLMQKQEHRHSRLRKWFLEDSESNPSLGGDI